MSAHGESVIQEQAQEASANAVATAPIVYPAYGYPFYSYPCGYEYPYYGGYYGPFVGFNVGFGCGHYGWRGGYGGFRR